MKEQTPSSKHRIEPGRHDKTMPAGLAKVLEMLGAGIKPPSGDAMGVKEAEPMADANRDPQAGKPASAP